MHTPAEPWKHDNATFFRSDLRNDLGRGVVLSHDGTAQWYSHSHPYVEIFVACFLPVITNLYDSSWRSSMNLSIGVTYVHLFQVVNTFLCLTKKDWGSTLLCANTNFISHHLSSKKIDLGKSNYLKC
jgi:hypothetical protein